jgi:drug/metabolite transporter (DMT)-like permease
VADLALLVLTLLWGTTFHFVKAVLAVASPGVFLAARFAVASLLLAAAWLVRRERAGPGLVRHALLLGLFMLAGFALQTLGLRHTTPSRSAFLTGLSVLAVPFIARFALARAVRPSSWAGVALAVLGLALLARPLAGGVGAPVLLGDALTGGCALAFALQITFTSEWSPRHPLVPFVLAQLLVTFAGALLLVPLEAPFLRPDGAARFAATVAFTGAAMTAAAFLVMNWAQRRTSAVRAALIFSLEPVAAALFSHFYGGERLAPAEWAGGALIVLGVIAGEVGALLEPRPA